MEEFKINTATVRIHNEPKQEQIKAATEKFLKQVLIRKKKRKQNGGNTHDNP